jgi:hypothetical protein
VPGPNEVQAWLIANDPQNQSRIVIETPGVEEAPPKPAFSDKLKYDPFTKQYLRKQRTEQIKRA